MTKTITLKDVLADEAFKPEGLSFENGLKLLEELVEKVESGGLPLDKAILAYERGVGLIEQLRGQLGGAEEKLKTLAKAKEK